MQDTDDSSGPRFEIDNITEFLAYLRENDTYDYCAHGRLWTRCWSCGHYESHKDDIGTENESVE
jgi:hypothetical protein